MHSPVMIFHIFTFLLPKPLDDKPWLLKQRRMLDGWIDGGWMRYCGWIVDY